LVDDCRFHLAGHKSFPDQIIKDLLILGKKALNIFWLPKDRCRSDGLMSILSLFLVLESMGFVGQIGVPKLILDQLPRFSDGLLGNTG
jgi:hypothetical protein